MSKASGWAKARPVPLSDSGVYADVTEAGSLRIAVDGVCIVVQASAALPLARWITDTFGDDTAR